MALVSAAELVRSAFTEGYAVAAVNTQGGNYDLVRAIVEAAAEERSPIILQAYESNTSYYGMDWLPLIAEYFSRKYDLPIAVHLDHGSSVDKVLQAVEAGFTSVMLDLSHADLGDNIRGVNEVIAQARPKGISVEAELGVVGRASDSSSSGCADAAEVAMFLAQAPVDMLAVGIGNAHGFYTGEPNIRLDLLREIRDRSGDTPLVLHGTTGIPEETVARCIQLGMAKINYGTLLRTRLLGYLQEEAGDPVHNGHAWKVSQAVCQRLREDIRPIIRLLGSSGRIMD